MVSADGASATLNVARLRIIPLLAQLDEDLLREMARRFVTERFAADRSQGGSVCGARGSGENDGLSLDSFLQRRTEERGLDPLLSLDYAQKVSQRRGCKNLEQTRFRPNLVSRRNEVIRSHLSRCRAFARLCHG